MDTAQSVQLDLVFGALSNPVRRPILDSISRRGQTVMQLAQPHKMSLNAVSKHIKALERAGLVNREVDGSFHRISINQQGMETAARWMAHYVPFWRDALGSLKAHLEQDQ